MLNRKTAYFILLLCCIPLFFLNVHNTHNPGGDDYAQYLQEAKNIASGKPYYASAYVFNPYNNSYSPPQYPPGFPLLLAPVVYIWGINVKAVCYFNTIIALLLAFTFFEYFRKHMGLLAALCLSLLVSYSSMLIELKQAALSDLTNLLFIMLYLALRNSEKFSWLRITGLVLCASMAILIRTQSVLLLGAEALWFLVTLARDWKVTGKLSSAIVRHAPSVWIIAGSVLVGLLVNKLILPAPSSASGFYTIFLDATFQKGVITIVRDNINFFLDAVRSFFYYETDNSIRTAMVTIMGAGGLLCCMAGFLLSVSRRVHFDDLFFILSCSLMLYYPIHDARYFLPAIGIAYYYCYIALLRIIPSLTKIRLRYIGFTIVAFCFVAGFRYLSGTTHPPCGFVPEQADEQAFSYLRQHVKENEVILCPRPRLIALYTDRKSIIFAWQHSMEENKRVCDSMGVRYVLLMKSIADEWLHNYLNGYAHPTDSLDIAPEYRLYTLK